jgi:ketosteroid isomerase-like protein
LALDAEDIAKIEQLNDTFAAALKNNDVSAILDILADDPVILPLQGNLVKGRAVQQYFLGFAPRWQNVRFMPLDLDAMGSDAARESGTFAFRARQQAAQRVTGSYIFIWRRAGSEWKLATAAWTRTIQMSARQGHDRAGTPATGAS